MNKSVTRRMTVARWRRFCFVMASSSSSIRVCDIVALASSRPGAAFCASAGLGDVAILCGIVSYSRDWERIESELRRWARSLDEETLDARHAGKT